MRRESAVGDVSLKPLSTLPPGTLAEVRSLNSSDSVLSRKLSVMGVVPGVTVKVASIAPLGDPIEIEIMGYSLALRLNEAETVKVAVID